jgi:hemolysin activation/secretion protein
VGLWRRIVSRAERAGEQARRRSPSLYVATLISLATLGAGLVALSSPGTALAEQTPDAAKPDAPKFDILAFQVVGNHLLPAELVEETVYPYLGPGRTEADVEAARLALQKALEANGYTTVAVAIPDQSVGSGVIRLSVEPQVFGKITVTGTKRVAAIRALAPSFQTGATPNVETMKADIARLNARANIQVSPDIKPGEEKNTFDVDLKVEERSSLHVSAEANNFHGASTSKIRNILSAHDDNVLGRGDVLTLTTQFSPDRPREGTVVSGSYLTRFGPVQGLVSVLRSLSDISTVGGTDVVGKGYDVGFRLIVPLSADEVFNQSITLGINYKSFRENVKLGADTSAAPIHYWPLSVSWRGDFATRAVQGGASVTGTFGMRGLGDDSQSFDFKRYGARPDFITTRFDGVLTNTLWFGFQTNLHLAAQYSDQPLISNEEFSVGGADTVRGYFESEALGDYGAAAQGELRTPALSRPALFLDELKFILFVDGGVAAIHNPLQDQAHQSRLGSFGAGLRVKWLKRLNASVDFGQPLKDGPNTKSSHDFVSFRLWGDF